MKNFFTIFSFFIALSLKAESWTDCSREFIEKDVHLKAGKVAAKDLKLESKTGKVKLEAGKDEDFYRHYEQSSGFLTTSTDDEGHDRKVSKPVEVVAQTVTVPSPAEIDYKVGLGKEFRETLAGRTDIDWKAVRDNYREWSEHTTTLSGPARMLVACVLSVVTQGMGTSKWLAGHGIAEGTATNAALSSGIQTLATSAGTALAANLGDFSKAFDELTSAAALKNLTASTLSAGLQLDTAASLPEATLKSAESLAIQTGLQNRKLSDILISDVVDAGAAQVAHGIGSAHATGTLGELGHKAAHGALAFTGAKLTGRDPVGAAVGAVVGEIAAESLHEDGKDPAKTANQARLVANTVAFLAGQDVASADAAAQNAIENNWWWTLDAYHYGKIYAEGGKEGVIEEIKEHPMEAALAAGGLGWVGRVGKGAKFVGKLAKAEKLEHKAVQTTKTISEAKAVTKAKIPRIIETKESQEVCWKQMKNSRDWVPQKGYKKPTLKNKTTGQLVQKSHEKFDIEVFNRHGDHVGVIRPSEGVVNTTLKVEGRKIKK